ncbi:MAG: glycerol-3-phosphate dehydrogenase [Kofleriaceae bacterium]|nr:glycerol-3-phosphate dehydrogenase [Kofleriaceae bacterium]MCL4226928.1 glycerol-3-phosphate dehydrogenase [Myxococcales bacterium]
MSDLLDLVVIGGGITGAGIARDAVLRGMKVALFEKGDYGSGTSSKSSKLVHGGLRYLEHGEIALVFESVSERRVQTRVAPHLVRPMPFLVPIFEGMRPGLELMNLGLWIYDSLALFRAPRMHKTFRGARAASRLEPCLKTDGLRGVIEYYDCATDDARLVLENVLDAQALGADCRNYTEVTRLVRDDDGRVRGVAVRDVLTGAREELRARAVVLAAGAWTDELIRRFEVPRQRELLRRTKGVHLVIPHERLPLARAITLISPVDGRVMFAIPWRGRTVLGTTDTDFDGTADEVHADAEDARYLCASINGYFPAAGITPADVIATWAGLRPLIRSGDGESASDTSREHEIFTRDDGLVIIAGGKLTTYRRMAKEAVRKTIRWLREHDPEFDAAGRERSGTKDRPLPGAAGLDAPTLEAVAAVGRELVDVHGLDADTATHLCGVYGVRARELGAAITADRALGERLDPELPYVWAEVDFAARADRARTVDDVLARRVPLLLVSRDQGTAVAERVAARLAAIHGWSADEVARQLAGYRQAVADSRRFRS